MTAWSGTFHPPRRRIARLHRIYLATIEGWCKVLSDHRPLLVGKTAQLKITLESRIPEGGISRACALSLSLSLSLVSLSLSLSLSPSLSLVALSLSLFEHHGGSDLKAEETLATTWTLNVLGDRVQANTDFSSQWEVHSRHVSKCFLIPDLMLAPV